jgi:hypothetical protein
MPLVRVGGCSFLHIFVQPSRAKLRTVLELFCRTDHPMSTARETEFFVIPLVDLGLNLKPRFLIREIHAAWSDSGHRIKWNVDCDALCCTPEEAQQH